VANLVCLLDENLAVGLEYQYLDRLVDSGLTGDNHRIQLTVYFGGAAPPPAGDRDAFRSFGAPSSGAPGTMFLREL
jgi:hypothetical protein